MIPQRVKISGFLCYQSEQEIRFDGSQLWMLSGLNGSGKSSIFDAMTYALFGHHRGGATQAVELINKDSKAMAVEFEFKIDQQSYMIRRTLKRSKSGSGSGSQQIYSWSEGTGSWDPIPDTHMRAKYDEWLREKIGLNYETFTSSVLLLQGKAEKLLDSKPSGRAEVLASIVDLERYQKLHEKSDTQRKALRAELEVLQKHFEVVPDVSDMELVAATHRIEDAEDAKKLVLARLDVLQQAEFHSRQWAEIQARLTKLRDRLKHDESILVDAVNIEKAFQRLRELREVLPHIGTIISQRSQISESERTSNRLQSELTTITDRHHDNERAQENHRKKRTSLEKSLTTDETRQREVDSQLRSLAGVMTKLREVEEQESVLKRLNDDLTRLPDDPDADVQRWKKAMDDRLELVRVVPMLERFAEFRRKLNEARQKVISSEKELQEIKLKGVEGKKRQLALETQFKLAAEKRTKADEIATSARTLEKHSRELLRDFQELEGAKICRQCGQPLTPSHFQVEKQKREQELAHADKHYQESRASQIHAQVEEKKLFDEIEAIKGELAPLREKFGMINSENDTAKKSIEQLAMDCRRIYFELPDDFRDKVAPEPPEDWLGTLFPTTRELTKLKGEANDMDGIRRSLDTAQKLHTRWTGLQAQLQSAQQSLERLKKGLPPDDIAKLKKQNSDLAAEEVMLKSSLTGLRKSLQENQVDLDRMAKDVAKLQQSITEMKGKIGTEEITRKHCAERIDASRQLLPTNWQSATDRAGLSEQLAWKSEMEELVRRNVEQRYKDLEAARLGLNTLRQEIKEREQEADVFPVEAKRDGAEIRRELQEAKSLGKLREDELRTSMKERDMLQNYRDQREQLRGQSLTLEREHNLYKLLSELLGRDRLQRHLVRQAERQIIDYANSVLDRLSGGQLYLRLCGGSEGDGTERALDLEAFNRTTGGGAINVAFLSGSQRFRVAVSLALGIGQYASRQHRPIESVIIDEGFGCLDRQGRQGMIQELQNLRGHLHCILLVSHQEEFAEAFPDGYKFELENGSTKVTRFAR